MQPAAPTLPPGQAYAPRPRRGRTVVRVLLALLTVAAAGLLVVGGITVVRMAAEARNDHDAQEGATGCDPSDDPQDTRSLCLYPSRPGREPTDHEAELGHGVRLAGYTATVDAGFINELVLDDQLGIRVHIQNRDDQVQPYGPLDWKIETTDGR